MIRHVSFAVWVSEQPRAFAVCALNRTRQRVVVREQLFIVGKVYEFHCYPVLRLGLVNLTKFL